MNQIIANRYEYKRSLGKGGMGSVFLAYDRKLDKYWAIKKCTQINDAEINALKTIDTFYFPRIVDVISENGNSYIVMDYIEGQTLTVYMNNHALQESEIIRISMQLASAIDYLHKQLPVMLFMDCKPDNIMLTANKEVRLVDLGSVYVCGATSPQRISSTYAYASPEIVNGMEDYTPSPNADIYSLGMTMYYMATGNTIEYRDSGGRLNIRWRNKHISAQLENIIRKCTCPQSQRYQSMEELNHDLKSAHAGCLKALSGKMTLLSGVWYETLDFICKITLCLAILFWARCSAIISLSLWTAIMFFMLGVFLLLCRHPRLNTVETKKNVFRGVGGRFLITLFTCLVSFGSYTRAASVNINTLQVNLYDDYGRNLLLKNGCELTANNSIHFSVPCEEINPGVNRLTISCESGESTKEYTILVNNTINQSN